MENLSKITKYKYLLILSLVILVTLPSDVEKIKFNFSKHPLNFKQILRFGI